MPIRLSWVEVKLAVRMLMRDPGLSFAGTIGMAVVIACGIAVAVFQTVVEGTLPFPQGDRVVVIENWDIQRNAPQNRALHDFAIWREQLTSIAHVGAYRLIRRTAVVPSRAPDLVRVAEISASAFDLAQTPPLLGRTLAPNDEVANAPSVVVIGEAEWRDRWAANPQVLGTTVQIGDMSHTIVGVMPRAFGFPVRETWWTPLRLNASHYQRGQGPELYVFGRLAERVSLQTARAEVATLGQSVAGDFPATHAQLRPRVTPYTEWFFAEMRNGETVLFSGAVLILLAIVCANVAVLVYARTATRASEITVRMALGASRTRIVGQMFVEGVVLALVAAAVGLAISVVMRTQLDTLVAQAPFWVNADVTSGTVASYVLFMTVLGGGIIGAVPAWQATRRRRHSGLHYAANLSSWRVGRTYSALTVVQVALAVAMLPVAVTSTWSAVQLATADPGFAAEEYLLAQVLTEDGFGTRVTPLLDELERRLESEPGVAAVTFMTGVPGSLHERTRIEVRPGQADSVAITQVRLDVFETFGVRLLAGRGFQPRDVGAANRPVIVNQAFAEQALGGNAVGRQLRQLPGGDRQVEATLEIIGVVPDFPEEPTEATLADMTVYEPIGRSDLESVLVGIHLGSTIPANFASRLREITTGVGGGLQVGETRTMEAFLQEERNEYRIAAITTGIVTVGVLLLSATGLYALIAFTVTQRRLEIGVRVAVGAGARQILATIVGRALMQLTVGIVIGMVLALLVDHDMRGELTGGFGLPMVLAVGAFVLCVGLCAAAGPARRALRIHPSEALRDE
jgi:putative ABC transport system permease protein